MASEDNDEERYGPKNLDIFMYQQLKMVGFVVPEVRPKYVDQFYATAPGMVLRGELKYREDVVEGLETVGEAFMGLMKGQDAGKSVVRGR